MSDGVLDRKWPPALRKRLDTELDFLVDEVAADARFNRQLDRMLELAGVAELPRDADEEPEYLIGRDALIRLLMVTTAAGRIRE